MSNDHIQRDYFPHFDYLRISLASVVMLGHDHVITWPASGALAVQIFFALSGWLIGGILLDLNVKDLPRFYMNRAARIWIPYYIAFFLILAASLLKDQPSPKWLEFIIYKASFVYNVFGPPQLAEFLSFMPLQGTGNHFWSVNAEEQFYLVAPLLLVVAASSFGRRVAMWAALSLVAWWANFYASIVFGVFAAIVVRQYGPIHQSPLIRAVLVCGVAATGIGLAYEFNFWSLAPVLSICTVLFLAAKGEQRPFGKFVGGVSYPLYLNHWIGVFVANYAMSPFGLRDSPARQAVSILINILLASALYWHVDRRMLALRGALYSEARAKNIMFAAYGIVIVGLFFGFVVR